MVLALIGGSAAAAYDIHSKALTPIIEKATPSGRPMVFIADGECNFTIEYDKTNEQASKAADLCFKADKTKKAQTIALKKGLDTNASIKVAEVR